MKKIILAIGILSLINVAVLHFLSHQNLAQYTVSVILVLYAIIYERIPRKIHAAAGGICLIPVAVAVFLAVYGNSFNVDYTEDVVIVLGAGLHQGEPGVHLTARLDTAIAYLNQNTDAIVIVCGGLGARQSITEAESMKLYLTARNVPPERVIMEKRSTSTYENLVFAREILDRRFPNGFRAVLVTNDFHVYRAASIAKRAGINVTPLGAPTPWFTLAANYLRETAAVTRMWIF